MKPGILYITHETDVNGASKSLIGIIEALEDKYDIHVLVRGKGAFTEALVQRRCKVIVKPYYLDVEPIRPNSLRSKLEWPVRIARYCLIRNRKNQRIVRQMAQYVNDENISLIHTNSSATFLGARLSLMTGIPHIWHFREFLKEDFNLHPLRGWNYFYRLASTSRRIICVSNAVLKKYQECIATEMTCIYNGVRADYKTITRKEHKGLNLLLAGVLSKGKGTDTAVKAVRILHEQRINDLHLYLAGRGNLDFCKDDYMIAAPYIHQLGFVKNLPEIRERYNIDVELVCSKAEAFGRVTIEAMAFGNPVIGADTGGTRELVRDQETGLLYKQGDAEDLASKIRYLIENPRLIRKYGDEGYTDFKKYYTLENCISKTEHVYAELLEERVKREGQNQPQPKLV